MFLFFFIFSDNRSSNDELPEERWARVIIYDMYYKEVVRRICHECYEISNSLNSGTFIPVLESSWTYELSRSKLIIGGKPFMWIDVLKCEIYNKLNIYITRGNREYYVYFVKSIPVKGKSGYFILDEKFDSNQKVKALTKRIKEPILQWRASRKRLSEILSQMKPPT